MRQCNRDNHTVVVDGGMFEMSAGGIFVMKKNLMVLTTALIDFELDIMKFIACLLPVALVLPSPQYASINGTDGALWASSPGFVVLPEECQRLYSALNKDLSIVQSSGFDIAGQKYVLEKPFLHIDILTEH